MQCDPLNLTKIRRLFALHPLKALHVSLGDNVESLEIYECDLNRISREREKNEEGEKNRKKAKGQWTCKIPG